MQIDATLTDEAALAELGARLERLRLNRDLTQQELGKQAGVAAKTVLRIEHGLEVRTASLIRVLRALGLLEALDRLVPEPAPSPIELLKRQGRERKRASGSRGGRAAEASPDEPWRWGDEPA